MTPWLMVTLCLGLGACEQVVRLDLPEGAKQLVVEARLERVRGAVSGMQRIRLTTTDAYFSNTAPPPARGATVQVSDAAGRSFAFTESSAEPGVYVTTSLMAKSAGATRCTSTTRVNDTRPPKPCWAFRPSTRSTLPRRTRSRGVVRRASGPPSRSRRRVASATTTCGTSM